eukprot:6724387-Alexandrium_andersonii.AAC.1
MDYCFPTKDGSDVSLTVLVLKDRASRAILSHPVLRKGRSRGGTVGQAAPSVHRQGRHGRALLKTDN